MSFERSKLEALYKKILLQQFKLAIPSFEDEQYLELVKIIKNIFYHVTPDIIKAKFYCYYTQKCLEELQMEIHEDFESILYYGDWQDDSKSVVIVCDGCQCIIVDSVDKLPGKIKCDFHYLLDPPIGEYFQMGDLCFPVENVSTSKSMYSDSTFKDLSTALRKYKDTSAMNSTCYILKDIWHDKNRMVLVNKPEHIMRRSLTSFLRTSLRSCDVEPEQKVDETHPVDIKISWLNSKALSLIEIKWLGDSIQEDLYKEYTSYRDARANEGAKQLADYLEMNKENDTLIKCRKGKLLVYDARRRSLGKTLPVPSSCFERDKACYYKDKEIVYNPDYSTLRDDFEKPERIYLEPRII